jgi:heme-degrading monooxygenase HmoA
VTGQRSLAATGHCDGVRIRSILRHAVPVILEHALLPVKPGEEAAFESAFAEAKAIIAATPGFIRLTLSRCLERPNRYLLLVEWDRLVDHTEGFRGSPQYQEWRRLLHSLYEPFPIVEHYEQVHSA